MEDQYGKSTLEDMINVRVVEQLAKKNKLKISKSEVDREFLLIKAVNNSFYEDEHTTEKEWKDQIRYNILLEDLLTRDIDISNKELESFYNKNKELYQFDDSYRIRHIVVKDEEEAREVLKELKGGSSQLPRIEITRPDNIIGKNTVSAMQSGILFGYVGQVEGIVKRMKWQAKQEPKVIATGGLAPLIANESDCIDIVDPFLTLKGLELIYERNRVGSVQEVQ